MNAPVLTFEDRREAVTMIDNLEAEIQRLKQQIQARNTIIEGLQEQLDRAAVRAVDREMERQQAIDALREIDREAFDSERQVLRAIARAALEAVGEGKP